MSLIFKPFKMSASVFILAMIICLINLSYSFTASSLHCAVRREISPCTCRHPDSSNFNIAVYCEKMSSFGQVVDALQDRFDKDHNRISLIISVSNLDDLPSKTFQELRMTITNLKLIQNNLSVLNEDVFVGLNRVEYFSLSDNYLTAIPSHILKLMPTILTMDLGRNQIKTIGADDLKDLHTLNALLLADNNMTEIHEDALPVTLNKLHMGKNSLTTLNGSLRNLLNLRWLFLNHNNLTSLENQFGPMKNLQLLLIHDNQLTSLPSDIQEFHNLDSLFAFENEITYLDAMLSRLKKLKRVDLSANKIKMLRQDDFLELENLEDLSLHHNQIKSINSSLVNLRKLSYLDLSYNELPEFLLQDLKGLKKLRIVDLSHNKIRRLGGRMELKNLIEVETKIFELRLQHNEIITLDGSLMGIQGLHRLNLSHNSLSEIAPDDFIGLEDLKMLDISHNSLKTLEETSKTFLPALEELMASHNALTALEKDFHGLPVLCLADLAHNNIKAIDIQLALKTQCRIHGLNSTLRIYLQGNPVLCEESMRDIIDQMESKNNTKVHGEMVCQSDLKTQTTTTTSTTTTELPKTTTSTTPEPPTTTISSTTSLPPTTTPTTTTTTSTTAIPSTTTSTTTETPIAVEESTETITLEIPQPNIFTASNNEAANNENNIPSSLQDNNLLNKIPMAENMPESSTGSSSVTLSTIQLKVLEPGIEYIVDNTTNNTTEIVPEFISE